MCMYSMTKKSHRKPNSRGYYVLSVVWPEEMLKTIDAQARKEHRSFSGQVVHLVSTALAAQAK